MLIMHIMNADNPLKESNVVATQRKCVVKKVKIVQKSSNTENPKYIDSAR